MLVVYGSETGNAQDVAEMLAAYMQQAVTTDSCALPMDCVTLEELSKEDLVLFVCSTTGQGDFPQGMQHTWKSMLRKSLPPSLLSQMKYAIFGLGDSGYVQFNVVAKKLDRRLEQLGGKRLIEKGLGDDQDSGGYEAALDPWIDTLFAALPSVFPKASAARPTTAPAETPKVYVRASRPAADTSNAATFANSEATIAVPAESRRTHFRAACSAAAAFSALAGIASGSKPWSASPLLEVVPDGEQPGIESSVAQSQQEGSSCVLRSIDSPFWAEVVKTERLTAADHWQVVQHIELSVEGSGLQYSPGDLLVTLPEAPQSAGEELLQHMGVATDAMLSIGINMKALPQRLQPPAKEGTCSHCEFFAPALAVATGVLDAAGAPPRRRLFAALAACAAEERERERLLHFASPEGRDDLATYCSRERRTLLEVLKDFPSAQLPFAQLLEVAPHLKPRQFSISSSPAAHPGRVHVTVAEVDYRTPFRRHIKGVCSSWLAALPVGANIPVWIEKGALALPPPDVPLICVGPGTGVAPFRSFMHERAALLRSGTHVAPSVLLFGCRNEAKDYLYAEEWRELMRLGVLKSDSGLICAFSRDQASKRYVQHCIREHKELLWGMLRDENASVFVAGSAEKMPEAVASACVDVITAGLLCSETDAKALQRRLESAKRYCVEAWG